LQSCVKQFGEKMILVTAEAEALWQEIEKLEADKK
jgi:hypothetical protein